MNNKNKLKSFTNEIYTASILPDCLSGIVLLCYTIFIANIKVSTHLIFIAAVIALIALAQFVIAPVTNIFICGGVNKLILKWRDKGLDQDERTKLFKKLHFIPKIKQVECFTYFFSCAILLFLYYWLGMKVNFQISCVVLFACCLGAYISSLLAVSYARKITSSYEEDLVEEGISPELLSKKEYFGTAYGSTFVSFCIIPVIWSILLFLGTFYVYFYNNEISDIGFKTATMTNGITKTQYNHIGIILLLNAVVCCVSVYSFLSSILVSSGKLQTSMTRIIKSDIFTVNLTSTDYANEVSYNIGLVNRVILLFRSIFNEIHNIGKTMIEPINKLSEISNSTATTSNEQSAAIKEIEATMEDTYSQNGKIVVKIENVTEIAMKTEKNAQAGFVTLQSNQDQMNEITEANKETISGIRELDEKISGIWEIVKNINDIAEQTRIIAFNAELEASSAGEAGKNFHIVANEVRRLAAGITNSVDQIKERITEIQHSSDNLIIASEGGTEKIRQGVELSEKLKEKFVVIKESSEVTTDSALKIQETINQQTVAFDQIVTTLRQIRSGMEDFSASANTVNDTATKLQEAANKLEMLNTIVLS